MSGMNNLDSNYTGVTTGATFATGKEATYNIQLFPAALNSQAGLCEKLKHNNVLEVDGIEFSFVADIFDTHANTVVINPLTGQQVPTKLPIKVVRISFNIAEMDIMLPFIFQNLYKLGAGLDQFEQQTILRELNIATERYFLQQANKFVQALALKGDNPVHVEYHELLRLTYLTDPDKQVALTFKIAHMLQARNLFKCALALISLYRTSTTYDFNKLADNLQKETVLASAELTAILKAPAKMHTSAIGRYEATNDGDNAIIRFEVTGTRELSQAALIEALKTVTALDLEGQPLKTGVKVAPSQQEPKCDMVRFATPSENLPAILDEVLICLQQKNFLFHHKSQYVLRKLLQSNNLLDYFGFVKTIIAKLLRNAEPDNLSSFEYNWLIRMSYELPVNKRAEFVCHVVGEFVKHKLHSCALGFASLYSTDRLCPAIAELVQSIQATRATDTAYATLPLLNHRLTEGATLAELAEAGVVAVNEGDKWVMLSPSAKSTLTQG